jgi:hypothetical protein
MFHNLKVCYIYREQVIGVRYNQGIMSISAKLQKG